jgi:hypothetical protein
LKIFSIFIVFLSAVGLVFQSGILAKKPRKNMFVYYTNLSNLAICVYELIILIDGGKSGFLTSPGVFFSMTMMIWITHLIFHFVLGPIYLKISEKRYADEHPEEELPKRSFFYRYVLYPITMGGSGKYNDSRSYLGNICVHYLAPLLTLLQWIIFADKSVDFSVCFKWLLIPLVYFIFAMIRAKSGVPIDKTGSLYPYPFMDLDRLGIKKFTLNVLCAFVGAFLVGCLLFLVTLL